MNSQPLPGFCRASLVFSAMVVTQLAVLLILLTPARPLLPDWGILGLVSLYAQWLVVVVLALLCLGRPLLQRLPAAAGWLAAWLLLVGCCAGLSRIALGLDDWLQTGLVPAGVEAGHLVRLAALVSALVGAAFFRYLWVMERWRSDQRARAQARVHALQVRIRPHFLFNTLNAIAALVPEQPAAAEQAIEDLSDLFRGSLREAEGPVPLAEELDLVRKYLGIEQLRLGRRLEVDWQLDGLPAEVEILPFSLQLLAENAIRHGVARLPAGGIIRLVGAIDGETVCITVDNPLPERRSEAPPGMALDNLRQRLALVYGDRARLVAGVEAGHYRARMTWPLRA